jgi:tryptophan synthase alpha chain
LTDSAHSPTPTLTEVFSRLASEGRTAHVAYLNAGFPDLETTGPALDALADAGADVIELGIPFSDPLADGPTIQAASFRALESGMTVAGCLRALKEFRERRSTPVVLFTYLNPVMHYGPARFAREAREAGAQGILLTDLPAGADPELEQVFRDAGLDVVRLLAPTTAPERLPAVVEGGGGFLYYISRTGVTGARSSMREGLLEEVKAVRERSSLPVAVGFGISTPQQAAEVSGAADGVVVGSALVKALEDGGVAGLSELVRSLRAAMDGQRSG